MTVASHWSQKRTDSVLHSIQLTHVFVENDFAECIFFTVAVSLLLFVFFSGCVHSGLSAPPPAAAAAAATTAATAKPEEVHTKRAATG